MVREKLRNWAQVDLDNLEYNYRAIRRYLRPECRYLAIVKADAYGHGAVPAAKTLDAAGADWFGVATLDEAEELRAGGIAKPILILGWTDPVRAEELARFDVTQAVFSSEYGRRLAKEAYGAGVRVKAHIKVDSGMHRIGFRPEDTGVLEEVLGLYESKHLDITGIFTHFAVSCDCGEADDLHTREQFGRFAGFCEDIARAGFDPGIRHCCNSAGIARFPEMHLDMVRAGITQYGMLPSDEMNDRCDMKPVMSLYSRVVQISRLPAGEGIGYGLTCSGDHLRTMATVPTGYADGYRRDWGMNRAFALIRGRKAPVIGRVCMDQLMLDITAIPEASCGDPVTLVGEDGDWRITFDMLADIAGTIGYECSCGISPRVPRIYVRGGMDADV